MHNKTKLLPCLAFFIFTISSAVSYGAEEATEKTELTELLKTLAILLDKGDTCGQHMNHFGKKALESPACTEFTNAFYKQWPSREALDALIADYNNRFKLGEYNCDNCDAMLERATELRTLVTYYLDYMDFLKYEL